MKQKKEHSRRLPSYLADLANSKEDAERYEEYFNSAPCVQIRKLLIEYLEKRISQSAERSDHVGHYDKPAWSEYQADSVGSRREDRHLIYLLKGNNND